MHHQAAFSFHISIGNILTVNEACQQTYLNDWLFSDSICYCFFSYSLLNTDPLCYCLFFSDPICYCSFYRSLLIADALYYCLFLTDRICYCSFYRSLFIVDSLCYTGLLIRNLKWIKEWANKVEGSEECLSTWDKFEPSLGVSGLIRINRGWRRPIRFSDKPDSCVR